MGAVWRPVYISAFRACEAGAGAVSSLLSADAHSPDGRLEGHDSTSSCRAADVYGPDFKGAGPGDGAGLHVGDCVDALFGWSTGEVLRGRSRAGLPCDVLHAVSCEVSS